MAIGNLHLGTPRQISATANLRVGPGAIANIFCSSSTAGTVTIYDDAATATTTKIVDTFTVAAGTNYTLNFAYANGLYIVVGGTTQISVGVI